MTHTISFWERKADSEEWAMTAVPVTVERGEQHDSMTSQMPPIAVSRAAATDTLFDLTVDFRNAYAAHTGSDINSLFIEVGGVTTTFIDADRLPRYVPGERNKIVNGSMTIDVGRHLTKLVRPGCIDVIIDDTPARTCQHGVDMAHGDAPEGYCYGPPPDDAPPWWNGEPRCKYCGGYGDDHKDQGCEAKIAAEKKS